MKEKIPLILVLLLLFTASALSSDKGEKEEKHVVSGILEGDGYAAIVDDRVVSEGDVINGTEVIEIKEDKVRLRDGNKIIIEGLKDKPDGENKAGPGRSAPKKKIPEIYSEQGLRHFARAKENYVKALEKMKEELFPQAYIYFKKARQYGQWSLNYAIRDKRKEMLSILQTCKNKMDELTFAKKIVEDTALPLLGDYDDIEKWLAENIEYKTDEEAHQKEDYWQTPQETIILRTGDCEDYSFLVQALLRQMGKESLVVSVVYTEDNFIKAHAFNIFPPKNPNLCFTPYRFRKMDGGFLKYMNKEYPTWAYIGLCDLETKYRRLLKRGDPVVWLDKQKNFSIIKDILE